MISKRTNHRRGRLLVATAVVLLAAAGITAIVFGLRGNGPPPAPAAAAPAPSATPTRTATPSPTAPATPQPAPSVGPILSRSMPTHVDIPAIGVSSSLIQLSKNADGTVQVPPLTDPSPAGWYTGSPTPGELGPAVILGHVDTRVGPSVFYRLGDIRPGDEVSVTRSDGTVAVFTVDSVTQYPKADFPTLKVYGNTDRAELRLITCGGVFNSAIGHYDKNTVVYATLTSSHPA